MSFPSRQHQLLSEAKPNGDPVWHNHPITHQSLITLWFSPGNQQFPAGNVLKSSDGLRYRVTMPANFMPALTK
jgi:hypothetical protein